MIQRLAFLLALTLTAAPAVSSSAQSEGVTVELDPSQGYYYEGDAVSVSLILLNSAAESVRNPIKKSASHGLEIRDADGRSIEAGAAEDVAGESLPRRLDPGESYSVVIDLSAVEPLRRAGTYRLGWSSAGHSARSREVTILPRFDASKSYLAHVETDEGPIDIRLLPHVSPLAVKAFVDLARAGFYDGSPFHEMQRDSHVVAGDPRFGRTPGRPLLFPAEQSALVVVPGTVVLKPVGAAPPANGSAFIISLRTQPGWGGQVTVLGQVVNGIEIAQRISRRPPSAGAARPGRGAVAPAKIRRVTITSEPTLPPGS